MLLAEGIRHLRTKKGLSARSLSLQAGLSPSYVGKLEAGEVEPSVKAFGKLAHVLGMGEREVFYCVIFTALGESNGS
jgi:transcriptional regulator with XRE-family HTH domain